MRWYGWVICIAAFGGLFVYMYYDDKEPENFPVQEIELIDSSTSTSNFERLKPVEKDSANHHIDTAK